MAEEDKAEDVEVRTAEGEVVSKTKEKKGLLGGPKVKIERTETKAEGEKVHPTEKMHTQQSGKTKGESGSK